jgi:hypothetical protein
VPTARSGHSFTYVGSFKYILYGGIDNSKKGSKILPTNDAFLMQMGNSKSTKPITFSLPYLKILSFLIYEEYMSD